MNPDDLKVVACRLMTGMARYMEFTLSDGQTVRVADPARIEAIVAALESGAPIARLGEPPDPPCCCL